MKKIALITGVTGQDGSYLAELLLSKGYRVVGMSRGNLGDSYARIRHIVPGVEMASGDLLIEDSLVQLIENVKPTEIYNLAAHSFLPDHRAQPAMAAEIAGLGVTRLLEAIRLVNPKIKFFQASSSEMFGNTSQTPQSEITPFQPNNLYAIAKVYAHTVTSYYRDTHNIFACSGILYNHESPRRNIEFVTRKVTAAAAAIKLGISDSVQLGNLDAKRDWSFAGDFVNGMWLMLQYSLPDDYILASGKVHSIRELCEIAFSHVGLDYKDFVLQDARYLRAPEQVIRVGDSSKAERVLGWNRSIDFANLVRMMVDSDLADFSKKSSKVV
jgi:GDPmannose 4,6-dehydratase